MSGMPHVNSRGPCHLLAQLVMPYTHGYSASCIQACAHAASGQAEAGGCVCSQQGCEEQEDILRPYSCLDYAWDEPSLPHQLVLSLPGNLQLGSYPLDKVMLLPSCRSPATRCPSLHLRP